MVDIKRDLLTMQQKQQDLDANKCKIYNQQSSSAPAQTQAQTLLDDLNNLKQRVNMIQQKLNNLVSGTSDPTPSTETPRWSTYFSNVDPTNIKHSSIPIRSSPAAETKDQWGNHIAMPSLTSLFHIPTYAQTQPTRMSLCIEQEYLYRSLDKRLNTGSKGVTSSVMV